jgi:hypothetical protein
LYSVLAHDNLPFIYSDTFPFSAKIPTNGEPQIKAAAKIEIETKTMNRIQIENTFFSCFSSCFP